jgi:Ca-activated chloride channel family protein
VSEVGFNFEQPAWFWGLLLLIPVAIWLWRSAAKAARGPIHRYADPHLLPHLTGTRELKATERWGRFLRWSALWALLILAMAGPRWDYEDVRLFHPGNNLLILLDISRSMQADDVAPNRLARARQEIQDLIMQNRQVRLGLIAFDSVPHVISPITEDTYTILNVLPALSTDLGRLQGSRLHAALDRAEGLLGSLPKDSARSILLISDGDFDEPDLVSRVEKLAAQGIRLQVLGVGTEEGARVPAQRGGWIHDRSGQPIRSVLNEKLLQELARAGRGGYQLADYREDDTREILEEAAVTALPPEAGDERTRIWNERFYLPVLAVAALLVPSFRRRARLGPKK